MKFNGYSGGRLSEMFSILVQAEADGINDNKRLREIIQNEIDQRERNARKYDRPLMTKAERALSRAKQQNRIENRKYREFAKKQQKVAAPYCPSCGRGKLMPSCGGTVTCTDNCGYSALRKQ